MAGTEVDFRYFRTPRGWRGWVVSALVVGLLGWGAVASEALWVWVLYGGIVIFYLARAVWGYSVQDGQVVVHRLGWTNRFDLETLQDAEGGGTHWRIRVAPGAVEVSSH